MRQAVWITKDGLTITFVLELRFSPTGTAGQAGSRWRLEKCFLTTNGSSQPGLGQVCPGTT